MQVDRVGDRGLDAAAVAQGSSTSCVGSPEPMVAHRAGQWFVQEFNQTPLGPPPSEVGALRRHGVYLIAGGLGNIRLGCPGTCGAGAGAAGADRALRISPRSSWDSGSPRPRTIPINREKSQAYADRGARVRGAYRQGGFGGQKADDIRGAPGMGALAS